MIKLIEALKEPQVRKAAIIMGATVAAAVAVGIVVSKVSSDPKVVEVLVETAESITEAPTE